MISIDNEHYRTIRRAIENNKLVVFVGSAVSFDSKLPSWGELIRSMVGALESSGVNEYLKVAEHYYLQYGRNAYFNKISDFFPAGSEPNLLHGLLLSLKAQHIITTNWDDLLEKEISKRGDLYFTVAADYELAASPSSQLLVKMHGDLVHRNIVFKESDYLSYADNFPLIENFIKSLFSTHVVVFLGYSISDFNLNQILSWVRNRTQDAPPSFTFLTEDNITLSETNYLRGKGVFPLICPKSDEVGSGEYPGLSDRSVRLAKALERVTCPEDVDKKGVISEIAADISSWNIVYPASLVQLVKERMNVVEINKVYYDASTSSIVYRLSDGELGYSRSMYRGMRASLLKVLSSVPVREIQLVFPSRRFIRVVNKAKFELEDDYTCFRFSTIFERVSSLGYSSLVDVDRQYQLAYDNYFLKRLDVARDAFLHLANMYYSKSQFVQSLLASFNKKHLCFGEIPWGISKNFLEYSAYERLSRNDNITEIVERFPKSIVSRQLPLYQGLDASNTFLLERFKDIATLGRELDEEADNINSGSMVFSNKLAAMQDRLYCIVMFVVKNRVAVVYNLDYKSICSMGFESVIKRGLMEVDFKLDVLLSYLAVASYKSKTLEKFLSDKLVDGQSLPLSDEAFNYLINVLNNQLDAFSLPGSRSLGDGYIEIWSKVLNLLSYVRHTPNNLSSIFQCMVRAFDIDRWFDLSVAINKFLVVQANKYEQTFFAEDLLSLLEKQVERLGSIVNIPLQERGHLMSNLLVLINDKHGGDKEYCLESGELEAFVVKLSTLDLKERMRAINSLVLTIRNFAGVALKKKIDTLLKDTFKECKRAVFDEASIVFCLNLFNVGLLNLRDLKFIMNKLHIINSKHFAAGSTTSHYSVLEDQLSLIDSAHLEEFKSIVADVAKLCSDFSSFATRANSHRFNKKSSKSSPK